MVALLITPLFYTIVPAIIGNQFGFYYGLLTMVSLAFSGLAAASVRPLSSSLHFIRSAGKVAPKDLKEERQKLKEKILKVSLEFSLNFLSFVFF